MKLWCQHAFLFLILLPGIASAGDEQQINERLKAGGTVYLSAGVYEIDGPIIIGSNTILTGDPDAIIKVSASSAQWFTEMTGIISSNGSVDNVEISGFQIDGSCDELSTSYADSAPQYDHDAERAIIINGYTSQFCNNIVIRNMHIYNCFSDGVHIRFANNVLVSDNVISNCQHEGIFLTSIIGVEVFRNDVAGITSDCIRLDNCVNFKVYNNLVFSYNGSDNNGAYKNGENGMQIGDAGSSHGYDASQKPTTTQNGEVYDNIFANNGLNAILLGSAGSDHNNNVYINDNKFIGNDELETIGIPVDGIYFNNMPTKEMSENIFNSIFDILDTTISDSGYVTQSSVFSPNKTLMSKGTESTWFDVVGYTGEIKIGNDIYIPKPANESAVVVSGTQTTRDRVVSQESTKKLTVGSDNNLTVDLEVKTTYNVPEKNKITILGKSINYTSHKKKSSTSPTGSRNHLASFRFQNTFRLNV